MMYMRFNFAEDWTTSNNVYTEVHLFVTFNNSGFTQEFFHIEKTDRELNLYTKDKKKYNISIYDSSLISPGGNTEIVYGTVFYGYDTNGNSTTVANTDIVVEWDEDYLYCPEFIDWLSNGLTITTAEEYFKFNAGRYCWVNNISAVDEGDVPLLFTCDGEQYTAIKFTFNNGANTHSLYYSKDSTTDNPGAGDILVYDGVNWIDEKYKTFQVTTYTEISFNENIPPANLSQYLYMGTLMFLHYSTNGDSDIKQYASHKSIKYAPSGISGKFTQVVLQKSTNGDYSLLSRMDNNKIYSIYTGLTYSSGYFYYDTSWKCSNSNYYIKSSTDTSVEFSHCNGTNIIEWTANIVLMGDSPATVEDFNRFESLNSNFADRYAPCLAENTHIWTDSGIKKVQHVTYDDNILVWNFDEGKLDYAKPIFIKQEQTSDSYWHVTDEDGKTVNLVGSNGKSHRLYNKRTHLFEYPQDIPECKCEEIHESVKYYNIVTAYHFNCYANGILTSKRYSNMLYPITDEMKYDKSIKHINCCQRNQFPFLTDHEFDALRLSEMEFTEGMRTEIQQFWQLKK